MWKIGDHCWKCSPVLYWGISDASRCFVRVFRAAGNSFSIDKHGACTSRNEEEHFERRTFSDRLGQPISCRIVRCSFFFSIQDSNQSSKLRSIPLFKRRDLKWVLRFIPIWLKRLACSMLLKTWDHNIFKCSFRNTHRFMENYYCSLLLLLLTCRLTCCEFESCATHESSFNRTCSKLLPYPLLLFSY